VQLEDADLDVRLGEALLQPVVVEAALLQREAQELLEQLGVDDELARVRAPLVGERGRRHAPAVVEGSDERVVGDEGVVEEHLVEVALVGDLAQGPDLDPGLVHVDHEGGDPLVGRSLGIAAGQQQPPIGELRVGRPHLLAGDPPPAGAVVAAGGRGERRQVAARPWFAEELAEELVGAQDAGQPPRLLLGGAVREQRADEVDADPADGWEPERGGSSCTM
jgi:hypothetical protein